MALALSCLRGVAASPSAPQRPRPRTVKVAFKKADDHFHGNQPCVWTAVDEQNGGLSADSQAVLIAAIEKQLNFREMRVDPANRPAQFVELFESIMPGTAHPAAPLLVDGRARLCNAETIVDYVARAYQQQGTALLPADPYAAARVQLFTRFFAATVVPALKALLHANDAALADAREALMRALAATDEFLKLHGAGDGDYAVGHGFVMESDAGAAPGAAAHTHFFLGPWYSTAECLCTPYVARMVEVLPECRGLDVMAECERRGLDRVAGWMAACLERPSARQTSPTKTELVSGLADWENAKVQ